MMPFSRRTYSFREKSTENSEPRKQALTPLRSFRKIKSRGRTNQIPIGSTTPKDENTQEATTPFTRGSVRLKSIRKRKMAAPMFDQVDGASHKREKMADKDKDEIELKIEENIKMRDGIMKLITGCHDTRQAMEIGKNLLTINSRMLSLMSSLQKKRSSIILKDHNKQSGSDIKGTLEPCLADLAISDIRIPLMWKSDAHFKTKAGEQSALLYHMFCLLKINDQVFDTPLVKFSEIDTDVTFDSVFTFQNISSDFKLEIEAYYSVMQNPDNPVWTPMRTPKKSTYSSVPKYCLAAHAQLTNLNIQDGFSVSDFVMGGIGASATAVLGHVDDFPDNPLALWGQFSCQLRATPMCMKKDTIDGYFNIQTANGGQPVWEKYFCRLRHCAIQGWRQFPEKGEDFSMTPGLSIRMKKGMKIRVEKSQELNKNIMILTTKNSEEKEPVFAFENEDDFRRWQKELQQAIVNAKAWKYACETFMNIDELQAKATAFSKAMNFYDHVFPVNGHDARQISPVVLKKGTRTASKPSMISLDAPPKVRSFYDQIDIAMKEKTAINTDEKVIDSTVTPEEKESNTNRDDVQNDSETQYDNEVKTDSEVQVDKKAHERTETDEPMETDTAQSDVSTADSSGVVAAENRVPETTDNASPVENIINTESDAVEMDTNGGPKEVSNEAIESQDESKEKLETEKSAEKEENFDLQAEMSGEQADKSGEGADQLGEQADNLQDVSDVLQELEDVLSTEIDFCLSESDESRVGSPEAEEKGQGDEAAGIVSEASESADVDMEQGEKGVTDAEVEGQHESVEQELASEVVSSTGNEESLTEHSEDIVPVENAKEGEVSDLSDQKIDETQEEDVMPGSNAVVTGEAERKEATVDGIGNNQLPEESVATDREKDNVLSPEDESSIPDGNVSNQDGDDSIQADNSLNETDTSAIDSQLAEDVSNVEDVNTVQEDSISEEESDSAVPEDLNSNEGVVGKDSSMQEDEDSKLDFEDSSQENEVLRPDSVDSKPENIDSKPENIDSKAEEESSILKDDDSSRPELDDCVKTENNAINTFEQEDCSNDIGDSKETESLNLEGEATTTNSDANGKVETDV